MLFALVLSGIGLVIAAFTPRRGIGVGVIVAVLVLLTGVVGVVQGIAMDEGLRTLSEYVGVLAPISLVDGVQVWLFDAEPSSAVGPPGTVGGLVYLAAALGVICACFGVLLLRFRKVLS